ncbi:hypothetical protein OQ968_03835 [Mycobacterium sp. 663a-19]|uniref:hypothetical protein n=1 Tax=Mycobacterium sp. 663a-19 TaxID=2986148 RepID=UPI002D1E527B|nr:hypothetical protein [Mycobacterium sp. 663a-19]MEB3980389.1 hypothetical protein [Mycobacterium sp. 663a-19]
MTLWYGENGWGWCSTIAHIPWMVILWAVVVTAMILAVGFANRQRNDPLAPTGAGPVRPEGEAVARICRSETDDDDFYRRLM